MSRTETLRVPWKVRQSKRTDSPGTPEIADEKIRPRPKHPRPWPHEPLLLNHPSKSTGRIPLNPGTAAVCIKDALRSDAASTRPRFPLQLPFHRWNRHNGTRGCAHNTLGSAAQESAIEHTLAVYVHDE